MDLLIKKYDLYWATLRIHLSKNYKYIWLKCYNLFLRSWTYAVLKYLVYLLFVDSLKSYYEHWHIEAWWGIDIVIGAGHGLLLAKQQAIP